MAEISGTIYGTTTNADVVAKIEWEETVDLVANTGAVTAVLYLKKTATYANRTYSHGSDFALTVNGTTKSVEDKYIQLYTTAGWVKCMAITVKNLAHDADGTKAIAIAATGSMANTSVTSITCGDTVELYPIPRASSVAVTPAVDVDGVNAVTVNITRASALYTHTVDIYAGDTYDGTDESYRAEFTDIERFKVFVIPASWRMAMPTTTSMEAHVCVTTYNDGVQVGDSVTVAFTLTVPDDIKPTLLPNDMEFRNPHLYPVQPDYLIARNSIFGTDPVYIQGYSGARAVFTYIQDDWTYNSEVPIVSVFAVYAGVKTEAAFNETEDTEVIILDENGDGVVFQSTGTKTITVGVTDARGVTVTAETSITCIAYSNPALGDGTEVFRCDSSGVAADAGTYISVKAVLSYKSIDTYNDIETLHVRYKSRGGSFGDWTDLTDSTVSLIGAGALSSANTYTVEIAGEDTVGGTFDEFFTIPTAASAINFKDGGRGVAFGKYAETDELAEFDYPIKAPGAEIDTLNLNTYTSVTQLGFVSGVPTINEVFTEMPAGSWLLAQAADFASGQTPTVYGRAEIIRAATQSRSSLLFFGKEAGNGYHYQSMASSGTSFDGTWHQLVVRDALLDLIYPVGAVYISVVSTSPATLFGGTWVQITDVFPLAAGSTYAAGSTGGEASHTLTTDEIPSHYHTVANSKTGGTGTTQWVIGGSSGNVKNSSSVGGGQAHNNMPPYLAVYMWKRTA